MRMLMYGAGNIGRGFIGAVFASAGYQVTFVDINEAVVGEINRRGGYRVRVAAETEYDIRVQNVNAVDGSDKQAVIEAIAGCDIMATSLGGRVLPHVAPLIAAGFEKRQAEGGGPLDILICENLKDAAHYLHGLIESYLDGEAKRLMEPRLGLVEAAIGRMVPVLSEEETGGDPLFVKVEEYDFLPVDRKAFRGPIPAVPQLVPHDPFLFYEERKLYLHNMSHCMCAYLGLLAGHTYIWQAMADARIRLIVQGAMDEACAMLSVFYGTPFHVLQKNADDLLYRFTNKALGDTCERVGRDPERKIAADDRLAAPLRRCFSLNIQAVNIAAGLAAVLASMQLDDEALAATLTGTCRLGNTEAACVTALHGLLKTGAGLDACITEIDRQKRALRGRTI